MASDPPRRFLPSKRLASAIGFVLLAACGTAGAWSWRAEIVGFAAATIGSPFHRAAGHPSSFRPQDRADGQDAHGGHRNSEGETRADHDGEGDHIATPMDAGDHQHSEAEAITLGVAGRKNVGVRLSKVTLGEFQRTITVPAIAVERPGWSTMEVTSPMTGVVSRIDVIEGQAVQSGQRLFEVRLLHEDLLQKQTDFLRLVEQLDVVRREVARLEEAAAGGAIAGKTLLERKYEQQQREAALRAERQALLLHGLSPAQVDAIQTGRELLQSLTVAVPDGEDRPGAVADHKLFEVQRINVTQGTYVTAGAPLCRLADYAALYVEGRAFEEDAQAINDAAANGRPITVVPGSKAGRGGEAISGLKILYLDNRVDPETRAFRFYVALPNHLTRRDTAPDGRQFVYWQFKPGQRMQVKVPVETWTDRIVLPAEAVVQEGVDFFVFEAHGDHFDRRAVHVEYRDAEWVVIANDGLIKPGVEVATSAAQQLQLALKNKSSGAVDAHAGHSH
mgnify:CR=1 FL=1